METQVGEQIRVRSASCGVSIWLLAGTSSTGVSVVGTRASVAMWTGRTPTATR